jgi:hypothetical protein
MNTQMMLMMFSDRSTTTSSSAQAAARSAEGRVTAGARDDWRLLAVVAGEVEARPSATDEQEFADIAMRQQRQAAKREASARVHAMLAELAEVERVIGRATPGDHRSHLRQVRHGLEALARVVD